MRSHGGVRDGYWFRYEAAGYNYRLSDVLGAIGVAQMEKLDAILRRRRTLAEGLRRRLADVPELHPPTEPTWGGHIYQSFVVLLDERLDRDRLVGDLREQDIETTLGTYALHDQPFFQRQYGYAPGQLPASHVAFTRSLTLPLYPQMEEEDLDTLVQAVKDTVAAQKE